MATYTSPKHAYESQLLPYMGDPSKLDFSGFEEFFSGEGHTAIDHTDNSPVEPSPLPFAYSSGSMSVSHGLTTVPVSIPTCSSSMNHFTSPTSFDHAHHSDGWFTQTGWLDANASHKSEFVQLDAKSDPHMYPMPQVDYSFLAGESNGLLGVDPSLIQHHQQQLHHAQHMPTGNTAPFQIGPLPSHTSHPISPATSQNSSQAWNAQAKNSQGGSPYYGQPVPWYPQTSHASSRRPSFRSVDSRMSQGSPRHGSVEYDDEGRERTQCPYPDCGKAFKDLKAHMLTHQNERPEKCPITSCEFHKRGFARKYDRNRHLVTTHYKATIVCGFCPGSGSSAEKSFNRTDVFKRHLVAVHNVEQTPSNSKKRTPRNSARQSPSLPDDITGKCSTCGNLFASPQELFEHFDDCVLRVVTQTDPGEETNEKNLRSVADDGDVKATMERHSLPNNQGSPSTPGANDDAEENSDSVDETIVSARAARSGKGSLAAPKSHTTGSTLHTVAEGHVMKSTNRPSPAGKGAAGLTYSKGGVSLSVGKGRKKRKHYPQSWGCSMDKMKLKKRVLCVFDGPRRLWKDDMMLGDDFEVRMQLPNGEEGSYVTDLDVETLKRADAFHAATEEERGPWIPSNYSRDWSSMQQQMTV